MPRFCPFNSALYASGLGHIGTPERAAGGRFSVLRREIGATGHADGVGPWPYLWIEGPRDIEALREEFRHLVTLAVVTQPGCVPEGCDAVLLKQHFVYDPALPPPALSPRARARLDRCAARARFEVVADAGRPARMAAVYRRLRERRELTGRYVAFSDWHFETIARLEEGVFFEVRDAEGLGAMACGAVFGDLLQILHIASTDAGLRWDASYLLMAGMQDHARARGLRLLTGGMPDRGAPGLRRFKERWANRYEPVHMLRIVNDPDRYAALCREHRGDPGFFPAYRAWD